MKVGITYTYLKNESLSAMMNSSHDFTELSAISNLKNAIQLLGYDVALYSDFSELKSDIENDIFDCDLIFNMAVGEGSRTRMGLIPMYLENKKIPYTGSDAYALQLSTNKEHMKCIAKSLNILTPKSYLLNTKPSTSEILYTLEELKFPIIVKPNEMANSLGLNIVYDAKSLIESCNNIFKKYNQPVLIEEYIAGFDVMVPILTIKHNEVAVGCVKYLKPDKSEIEIFDTKTKHDPNLLCVKADISDQLQSSMKEAAIRLHNFIPFCDFSRMDFRVNEKGDFYFLESNALPDLNKEGAFSIALEMNFSEIIDKIIKSAIDRYNL